MRRQIADGSDHGRSPIGSPPFFPGTCPVNIYQTTTTDKRGFYSFSGLYLGTKNVIGVSKVGFEDPSGSSESPEATEGGQAVTIDGDTRFDIQLVRR